MKLIYTLHFKQSFRKFPKEIQTKFNKQASHLLSDIRHPSLRAKKYDEERKIWQARVDRSVRFYFLIQDDSYLLLEIKSHPK